MTAGATTRIGPSVPSRAGARSRLMIVAWIGIVVTVGEAIAGVLTQSLALLTDSVHAFTHAISAAIAYGAIVVASRPTAPERTFRNWRVEILAALLNGLLMLPLVGYMLYEAWHRFRDPLGIDVVPMLVVAGVGLVANLACAAVLHARAHEDVNVRSAFLHMIADTAASVGVMIAGAGLLLSQGRWSWIDPAVAAVISLMVLRWCVSMIRDAARILLEAAPAHIDLNQIRCELESVEGVQGIHDLHVWTITSRMHALTAHVILRSDLLVSRTEEISRAMLSLLRDRWDVNHATLQFEAGAESCEPAHMPGTGPIPTIEPHDHSHD